MFSCRFYYILSYLINVSAVFHLLRTLAHFTVRTGLHLPFRLLLDFKVFICIEPIGHRFRFICFDFFHFFYPWLVVTVMGLISFGNICILLSVIFVEHKPTISTFFCLSLFL